MTRRYESRLKMYWNAGCFSTEPIQTPTMTIIDHDRYERNTGLLDARGNPIVSVEEIGPIGFNRI